MTEIKTKRVKLHNVGIMLILSIVTILYFTMLVAGDENGQEYEFYNAAKEGAIEYADLGIITPEPIANIAFSEKQAGDKAEYLFNIPESVYKIKIRNTTITNEKISIETLKSVSSLTTSIPAGNVYINENIWVTPDTDIYVDFKIKNSWLVDMENVKLLKWTGDRWKKLGLRQIGKDDTYTYFEEGIAGSSVLTIVGDDKSSANEGQREQKSFLSSLPMNTIIIIILGLVLIIYIVTEEMKKK